MWQKKYPNLAGLVSAGSPGPTVAPVGLSQPALATRLMKKDLAPQTVPNQLPKAPILAAQPDMDQHVKQRALMNIARGVKGF